MRFLPNIARNMRIYSFFIAYYCMATQCTYAFLTAFSQSSCLRTRGEQPFVAQSLGLSVGRRGLSDAILTRRCVRNAHRLRLRGRFRGVLVPRASVRDDLNCFVNSSNKEFYQSEEFQRRIELFKNKTFFERSVALRYSHDQLDRVHSIYEALRQALAKVSRFDYTLDASSGPDMLNLEDLRSDEMHRDFSSYEREVDRVRENFPAMSREGFLEVEPRRLQRD